MIFTSYIFLLFLPLVFCLYWFVFGRSRRWQNILIVAASYVFYGWWSRRFLVLIAFTSLFSWVCGLLISRLKSSPKTAWMLSLLNIIVNLGILFIFKYYNFFVTSFADVFLGGDTHGLLLNVALPVGVSFYTFQAISYTIDIYRGKAEPTKDIVQFFAYVSFFPQLVAGPIERATHLLPQFGHDRKFDYGTAVDGMRQMLWGFFKKVVVANECARYVDYVFANYNSLPGYILILGIILFAFQIYGDFSGYSDIALGCAKLFGIRLMQNFKVPFLSRDIAEFWRRWHISLTSWFKDYVYYPLGGSRCGKAGIIRNTFIIFLLSGLWHGANWTYIVWAVYNALLFLPLILLGRNRRYLGTIAQGRAFPTAKESGQVLLTFTLFTVGLIFFRSPDIGSALHYFRDIFPLGLETIGTSRHIDISMGQLLMLLTVITVMNIAEYINRDREYGLDLGRVRSRAVRWGIYIILVIAVSLCFDTGSNPFIYFQF